MTDEGKHRAVPQEIARADEEIRIAEQVLALGSPRIAITRAYYAVYHAARARLYAEDLEPRTHRGVQHLFNLHFVQTGRYDAAVSRLLARLQKFREEADYAEAFVIDEAGAREEIEAARTLVARIREELQGP